MPEGSSANPHPSEQMPGSVPGKAASGADSGATRADEDVVGHRPGAARPRYEGSPTGPEAMEFIEAAGVFFERLGLSRTAGRVMGWLLVNPDSDAVELTDRLTVAKSSMSLALRHLDQLGLIERFRRTGDRRDRYRLAEDVFARSFRARMSEFAAFCDLAERGLAVVGADPERRIRLELMRDMYTFMAVEFPKLLDRWDGQVRARRSGRG